MPKTPRKHLLQSGVDARPVTHRKAVPHRFLLDAIESLHPTTRTMFGALAVYVGAKIVFILRDRPADPDANGIWIATSVQRQASLHADFPNAGPVKIMGKDISGWRLLAVDAHDFEASALHACELVLRGDPRIGKVPNSKRT